ncbi:MAG: hypothetical protein U0T73_12695 [Chitinophagales bacterium]
MKRKLPLPWLMLPLMVLLFGNATAQGGEGYGDGLKVKFDSTGNRYIRFMLWSQLWMRYSQNNPGSTINGKPYNSQFDIALRRTRLAIYAQVTPKFMILLHMGINNQTLVSGGALGQGGSGTDGKKPQFFIHEITMEHKVYKDYLTIGAGLHYYGGLSRKTMASTTNFMAMDAPIVNWRNIDADDQFGRNFGAFAKGKVKGFEYRIGFYMPFVMLSANTLTKLDTALARHGLQQASYRGLGKSEPAVNGYFNYQFFDKEANLLPYYVNSYMGSKKVFNVGAGFDFQKNSMWSVRTNSVNGFDTISHNQFSVAADVFADIPFKKLKGCALTAYAVYYFNNMGPNFVRNIGISNPANGTTASAVFNGAGDAFPVAGTGHVAYVEAGWLLPPTKKVGKFQVYADFMGASYQRLKDPVLVYNAGINWLLNSHHCKLTLNYRNRPVFDYTNSAEKYGPIHHIGSRNEFTIQFQAFL